MPEDTILCTIDVVGLYPNIPHEDGLVVMPKAFDEREDKTVSTDSLIELAECFLKNNIFEHHTSLYKQLRGTAIGTKMAPPYAILFMGDLETKMLKDCDKKPLTWWRYIDDIFMLWQHGGKELTLTYIKPADTHQYLHASSCHVYHSKKSIPYSQALRLNRIRFRELVLW